MSRLSQRQASAQWGIARITLQRAINAGTITKDIEGRVDAADLLRLFGEPKGPAPGRPNEPPKATVSHPEPPQLQAENARLKLENEWQRQIIDQLKARAEFAEQAVKMITHQEGRSRPSWWKRTFG